MATDILMALSSCGGGGDASSTGTLKLTVTGWEREHGELQINFDPERRGFVSCSGDGPKVCDYPQTPTRTYTVEVLEGERRAEEQVTIVGGETTEMEIHLPADQP